MKRFFIAIMVFALCVNAWSVTPRDIFNELKSDPEAHYVVIGKQMLGFLGDFEGRHLQGFLEQIDSVCVLSLEECGAETTARFDSLVAQMDTSVYTKMLNTSDDGERVTIYARQDGNVIYELPMVARTSDGAQLIVVYGRIDPENVAKLVQLM